MKVGIVAGEKSGDYLGAELIKAIKARFPNAEFIGLCGPLMQEQGAVSLAEMDKISIMGLEGLLTALPGIVRIRRLLFRHFVENPPDVFIGIDVPDFNLGLERKLKALGIPTVHYVSPTVWAWRGSRIDKIKESVNLMLTLFPFERIYYQNHQIPVECVGHPLAQQVLDWKVAPEFRKSLANENQLLVAVLPGSRMSEVSRLAPPMLDAVYALAASRPTLRFVIPTANHRIHKYLTQELAVDTNIVSLVDGRSRDVLCVSNLAILASGTAALEAGLFAIPMVVMYKMAWLTVALYKHTVTVEYFSMPNHLTNPPVVPELIQKQASAENLIAEAERLLDCPEHYHSMHLALAEIAPRLARNSGELACEAIVQMLGNQKPRASLGKS